MDKVAHDLLDSSPYYLVLVPTEDGGWEYIWHVKDEEQKKKFQKTLRQFTEEVTNG